MIIESSGIVNGIIDDKYGKRGKQKRNGVPSLSLPIKISDAPKGTVTFAVVIDDKDAVEVCGFTWIHWLVANLKTNELEENASILRNDFIEGVTSEHSAVSPLSEADATCYVGMAPPDKPHRYDITVYALDTELKLAKGFTYNKLWYAMKEHIIETASITGVYNN